MNKHVKLLRLLLLLLMTFAVVSVSAFWRLQPDGDGAVNYFPLVVRTPPSYFVTGGAFESRLLNLHDFHLFDLGIADINADSALDIYTVNHSARQSLLLNDGSGYFSENLMTDYGLDQALGFPGLEDSLNTPLFSDSGLYIYWHDSALVFKAYAFTAGGEISGSATFIPEIDVIADPAFDYELTSDPLPNGALQTTLDFTAFGEGEMHVTPLPKPSVGSPINVEMDPSTDLGQIFIGLSSTNPQEHNFLLHLKDRHGMAWADYNEDGKPDVYMSRGGNRGDSELYPQELIIDQFYESSADEFDAISTAALGFVKDGCAARQIAWTDVNGDDLLDLYIVCARGDPNQLYLQGADGFFSNVAVAYGLALRDDGDFVWLDADGDNDLDMFWAGTQEYRLYRNEGTSFSEESLATPNGRAAKLTVNDYDRDGFPDIFAASPGQSVLFHGVGTGFIPVAPHTVGLPPASLTANWVDYDNDGQLDLHTVPQGLFRQLSNGIFVATDLLSLVSGAASVDEARATWFDADGDGYRDFIATTHFVEVDDTGKDRSRWSSQYVHNLATAPNNWLSVDLVGPPSNQEAIGAAVMVETGSGNYTQQIGWSEGARYSLGHYRLYFGLGDVSTIEQVTVMWPSGDTYVMHDVPANNLLVIEQFP